MSSRQRPTSWSAPWAFTPLRTMSPSPPGSTAWTTAVVNPKESFLSVNGEWSDWTGPRSRLMQAFQKEADLDVQIDNFPIKAYGDLFAFLDPDTAYTDEDILDTPHFDLREFGLVTPVKSQGAWSTCWGFAAIAASEISILNETRQYLATNGNAELAPYAVAKYLDLSEHQLAWFAMSPVPDGAQEGEGIHVLSGNPLDTPGYAAMAASVFAAGTGPIPEELAPYTGANGEKAPNGDWSLDESLRYLNFYQLEDSAALTSPAGKNADGKYAYNPAATLAIKRELLRGRGVVVGFAADQSR